MNPIQIEMTERKTIYTLGTSNRSIQEFIDVLNEHGIERVIDVRRFPTSKFAHFRQENLAGALERAGYSYDYFGDTLGGFRSGGYKSYMRTDAFCEALKEVERLAENGSVVILCAERLPWRCHRRFIGAELKERGWRVIHILEKDKTWEPKEQLDLIHD